MEFSCGDYVHEHATSRDGKGYNRLVGGVTHTLRGTSIYICSKCRNDGQITALLVCVMPYDDDDCCPIPEEDISALNGEVVK